MGDSVGSDRFSIAADMDVALFLADERGRCQSRVARPEATIFLGRCKPRAPVRQLSAGW